MASGSSVDACKFKGFHWTTGATCADATTASCSALGLTNGICTVASGDTTNTGIHCALPVCTSGAYPTSGATARSCADLGFLVSSAACVIPTTCAATAGPYLGYLCAAATG